MPISSNEVITSSIASLSGEGVFPLASDRAAGDGVLDKATYRSFISKGAGVRDSLDACDSLEGSRRTATLCGGGGGGGGESSRSWSSSGDISRDGGLGSDICCLTGTGGGTSSLSYDTLGEAGRGCAKVRRTGTTGSRSDSYAKLGETGRGDGPLCGIICRIGTGGGISES